VVEWRTGSFQKQSTTCLQKLKLRVPVSAHWVVVPVDLRSVCCFAHKENHTVVSKTYQIISLEQNHDKKQKTFVVRHFAAY
jgi:hypothetical protein